MFSLGDLYLNNFLAPGELPGERHELSLIMDESCGAARLEHPVDNSKMFGKYWYQSGTNESMKAALKDVVDSVLPHAGTHYGQAWIDIASNDGTLLRFVPDYFIRMGVDPCEKRIYEKGQKHSIVFNDYFKKELFTGMRASVITCIAMFYDLTNPDTFLQDVYEVLDKDGIFVIQQSYAPLMLKQLAFDNICHEHNYYHSLTSMKIILERTGFEIVDCTLNDVNGGSFRLFIKKKGAKFASQPYRDVCNMRIESLLQYEQEMKISDKETWLKFITEVIELGRQVTSFIHDVVAGGKVVMGYGASTKGNTLLQFFGLDNTCITAIAERQPSKWGLHTPGTNIPIISEEEMRAAKPDYLLVLPWHFIAEFTEREKDFLNGGGHFIVPCPKFVVI